MSDGTDNGDSQGRSESRAAGWDLNRTISVLTLVTLIVGIGAGLMALGNRDERDKQQTTDIIELRGVTKELAKSLQDFVMLTSISKTEMAARIEAVAARVDGLSRRLDQVENKAVR